jgi:phosphoribosyl-AMP cyclohydrolase
MGVRPRAASLVASGAARPRRDRTRRMSTTFADPQTLSHAELEEGTVFAPRFDEKGLVTAIAVEAGSNTVLMVAHMSAEALRLTIDTGEVHYFSRSRGKIWKKGETSGEVQRLVELRTDCDQDAILVVVEQTGRGAACHTGRKSCFYRRLSDGALIDIGAPRLFDPADVYGA